MLGLDGEAGLTTLADKPEVEHVLDLLHGGSGFLRPVVKTVVQGGWQAVVTGKAPQGVGGGRRRHMLAGQILDEQPVLAGYGFGGFIGLGSVGGRVERRHREDDPFGLVQNALGRGGK